MQKTTFTVCTARHYISGEIYGDMFKIVLQIQQKPLQRLKKKKSFLSLASLNELALCQQISPGVWNMLATMRDDVITSTVKSDFSILQLAQSFLNKF